MTRNPQAALARDERPAPRRSPSDLDTPAPLPLTEGDRDEALSFLAARPLQTFFLAGLIRDNGVESPLNRGTFYACRAPAWRGRGIGLNCLSLLGRTLLGRVRPVCLLVDERNERARALYRKAGFRRRGGFDTFFLERTAG